MLEYGGPSPQPLFVMGRERRHRGDPARRHQARAAYVAALPDELEAVAAQYRSTRARRWSGCGSTGRTSGPIRRRSSGCLPVEIGELNRLYQLGFASWLPSSAIADGVYYGIRVNGRLVAAAGTHVISRGGAAGRRRQRPDPAGVPRVAASRTAVDRRRHRRAARVCDQVVLNVRSDNPPALNAYRHLGVRHQVQAGRRVPGPASRKSAPLPPNRPPVDQA